MLSKWFSMKDSNCNLRMYTWGLVKPLLVNQIKNHYNELLRQKDWWGFLPILSAKKKKKKKNWLWIIAYCTSFFWHRLKPKKNSTLPVKPLKKNIIYIQYIRNKTYNVFWKWINFTLKLKDLMGWNNIISEVISLWCYY